MSSFSSSQQNSFSGLGDRFRGSDAETSRSTAPTSTSSACYALPLSPLSRAFGGIQWEALSARLSASPSHPLPGFLSTTQCSILRRSETNPMEYTLAAFDEAHTLCRTLLQVLELIALQPHPSLTICNSTSTSNIRSPMTSPISMGMSSTLASPMSLSSPSVASSAMSSVVSSSTLSLSPISSIWDQDEQVLLDEYHALQVYYEQPLIVVTHFVISQLYDLIRCLLESASTSSSTATPKATSAAASSSYDDASRYPFSTSQTRTPSSATAAAASQSQLDDFFNPSPDQRKTRETRKYTVWDYFYNPNDGSILEDWRPLLKILYKAAGGSTLYNDTFVARGASVCLAYILRAGCPSFLSAQQRRLQRNLLLLNPSSAKSEAASSKPAVDAALEALVAWITARLQSASSRSTSNWNSNQIPTSGRSINVRIVTPALMVLSSCHESRIVFDQAGGIGYLVRHIRGMLHMDGAGAGGAGAGYNNRSSSGGNARRTRQMNRTNNANGYGYGTSNDRSFLPSNSGDLFGSASSIGQSTSRMTDMSARSPNASKGQLYRRSTRLHAISPQRTGAQRRVPLSPMTRSDGSLSYDSEDDDDYTEDRTRKSGASITNLSMSTLPTIFRNSGLLGSDTSFALTTKQSSETIASPLPPIRKTTFYSASVQQLYELVFCLWTLTYECCNTSVGSDPAADGAREAIIRHFQRDNVIQVLSEVVASGPREKIVRLGLSSLRNLATLSTGDIAADASATPATNGSIEPRSPRKAMASPSSSLPFLTEMIGHGLHRTLSVMKDRKWRDDDIKNDLSILRKLVDDNYHEMTKYQLYEAEVQTGHLRWGILHKERFFQQNARNMEARNFDVVKRLITILSKFIQSTMDQYELNAVSDSNDRAFFQASTTTVSYNRRDERNRNPWEEEDEEIAAIACRDIGEFVRFYPNGKSIATRLGAKVVVMKLIHHDNELLQHEALLCMSKLLVSNWRMDKFGG